MSSLPAEMGDAADPHGAAASPVVSERYLRFFLMTSIDLLLLSEPRMVVVPA